MTRLVLSGVVVILLGSAAFAAPVPKKDDPKPTPEQAMEEVRGRWNKLAGDAGPVWKENMFPHPTFSGGSKEAYGKFARHLVKFLDEKGNFDYLVENNLLDVKLPYRLGGGQVTEFGPFSKLITDFSGEKALGDHDDDTRKALKGYADKIAEKAKKDK